MTATTPILISIVIPTYEMKGEAVAFLGRCLDSIDCQKNILNSSVEIIISDQSNNEAIKLFCRDRQKITPFAIRHHKTTSGKGNAAHNLNTGISLASGKYIKILFQDDLLVGMDHLAILYQVILQNAPDCILTKATHTKDGIHFYDSITPTKNSYFLFGNNTISSPSVLTVSKNFLEKNLFDEKLKLLFDCEFYHRLFNASNKIEVCESIAIANGVWEGQTQFAISNEDFSREVRYLNQKYPNAHLQELLPEYKALFHAKHPQAPFPFSTLLKPTWLDRAREYLKFS
jgi:glycosyltransferase involved in cell wall biosynthesis